MALLSDYAEPEATHPDAESQAGPSVTATSADAGHVEEMDETEADEPVRVERSTLKPRALKIAALPKSRSGTRASPYARKDGIETIKVAFSASADFANRLRVFTAGLPATTSRNEWIEQVLERAMDRETKRR
jgi:hypothetical protein